MPNEQVTNEIQEAYQRALDLLRVCASPAGFLASPGEVDNYARVWARDGVPTYCLECRCHRACPPGAGARKSHLVLTVTGGCFTTENPSRHPMSEGTLG